MFDKLLLPVDPSKRLKPSREYAIALAKRLNIPLTAIFVSNPSKTGTMTASDETSKGFATLGKRQLDILVEGIWNGKAVRAGIYDYRVSTTDQNLNGQISELQTYAKSELVNAAYLPTPPFWFAIGTA